MERGMQNAVAAGPVEAGDEVKDPVGEEADIGDEFRYPGSKVVPDDFFRIKEADTIFPNAIADFTKRFEADGLYADGMITLLRETKSVIAGSYCLQTILGEIWKGSDIDIWCNDRNFDKNFICKILLPMGFNLPTKHHFIKTITDNKEIPSGYRRLNRSVTAIYTFNHYDSKTPDIQFIVCNNFDYAIKTFDLNLCRLIFDGENLTSINESYEMVMNRVMTITKESSLEQSPWEWIRTLKRINKYHARGFKFVWYKSLDQIFINQIESNFVNNVKRINDSYFSFLYTDNKAVSDISEEAIVRFRNKWNHQSRLSNYQIIPIWLFDTERETIYLGFPSEEPIVNIDISAMPLFRKEGLLFGGNSFLEIIKIENDITKEHIRKISFDKHKVCMDNEFIGEENIDDYLSKYPEMIVISVKQKAFCIDINRLRQYLDNTLDGTIVSDSRRSTIRSDQLFELTVPGQDGAYFSYNAQDAHVLNQHNLYLEEIKNIIQYKPRSKGVLVYIQNRVKDIIFGSILKDYIRSIDPAVIENIGAKFDIEGENYYQIREIVLENIDSAMKYLRWFLAEMKEDDRVYILENSKLLMKREKDNKIFYHCKGENDGKPILEEPYYRLQLESSYMIPLRDILIAIKVNVSAGVRRFEIKPSLNPKEKKYMMSHEQATYYRRLGAFNRHNLVSADHCQEGTHQYIYNLYPVSFEVRRDLSPIKKTKKLRT